MEIEEDYEKNYWNSGMEPLEDGDIPSPSKFSEPLSIESKSQSPTLRQAGPDLFPIPITKALSEQINAKFILKTFEEVVFLLKSPSFTDIQSDISDGLKNLESGKKISISDIESLLTGSLDSITSSCSEELDTTNSIPLHVLFFAFETFFMRVKMRKFDACKDKWFDAKLNLTSNEMKVSNEVVKKVLQKIINMCLS